MKIAERMNRLGTETAFEVLARAKALEAQGRDIIHLQIGEPDFDTPSNIVEAGAEALRNGYTHYGPSPGMPELREGHRRRGRGDARHRGGRRQRRRHVGRQADHVLHHACPRG